MPLIRHPLLRFQNQPRPLASSQPKLALVSVFVPSSDSFVKTYLKQEGGGENSGNKGRVSLEDEIKDG